MITNPNNLLLFKMIAFPNNLSIFQANKFFPQKTPQLQHSKKAPNLYSIIIITLNYQSFPYKYHFLSKTSIHKSFPNH